MTSTGSQGLSSHEIGSSMSVVYRPGEGQTQVVKDGMVRLHTLRIKFCRTEKQGVKGVHLQPNIRFSL